MGVSFFYEPAGDSGVWGLCCRKSAQERGGVLTGVVFFIYLPLPGGFVCEEDHCEMGKRVVGRFPGMRMDWFMQRVRCPLQGSCEME